MSALGYYLEDEGLPTVSISLVRKHTEKIEPPRALWVPFELGRPVGPANDPAFQKRVLRAALGLLESSNGPVVLEDFDIDMPGAAGELGWRSPIPIEPADPDTADHDALTRALEREMALVRPVYERAVAARGRTTVGLARVDPAELPALVVSFFAGGPAENPVPEVRPGHVMRYASDDLRAYYLEAASFGDERPSSLQLADWYWDETLAGRTVMALRAACLAGSDKVLSTIAKVILVPGRQVDKLPPETP